MRKCDLIKTNQMIFVLDIGKSESVLSHKIQTLERIRTKNNLMFYGRNNDIYDNCQFQVKYKKGACVKRTAK